MPQRLHSIADTRQILFLHIDTQLHRSPRPGREAVLADCQIASHQSKQVAGLGKRILPDSKVPAGHRKARHKLEEASMRAELQPSGAAGKAEVKRSLW